MYIDHIGVRGGDPIAILPAASYDADAARLEEARETIERLEGMAVRHRCLCGRPTGTAAMQACARAWLTEKGTP
jgi:hypothetical protein